MHIPLILPHPEGQKKLSPPHLYFGVRKRLGVNICTNEHFFPPPYPLTQHSVTRVYVHTRT